jgi:hypothetical protein
MRFLWRRTFCLVIVCLLVSSFATLLSVQSQVCSGCEVSNQRVTKSNQRLNLTEKADAGTVSEGKYARHHRGARRCAEAYQPLAKCGRRD